MTELAKLIEVRSQGGTMSLLIDGQPFPWHTAADGWHLSVTRDNIPGITLTIVAERLEVTDSISPACSGAAGCTNPPLTPSRLCRECEGIADDCARDEAQP